MPGNRPSRAIIALATQDPLPLDASAEVVTAVSPSGEGELRCELVHLAAGDGGAALPSLIASLLLPDLPVFLLLRLDPELWEPLVKACWPFATRVVVDSTAERSGLHSLKGLLAREPSRSVTDLSWTKLTGWRELVARLFDPPKATRALARLDRIEVTHSGRSKAQARLLAAWILSRTDRQPSVELTSETRRDMRPGSLISVALTCRKERYEVARLAEGVAELRSPYLEPQRARLWVPHMPALIAEELGVYERDEAFEAAVAQLAT
jgi:glucose-6-phosphate dehydrogenase assembly protein OpcA